MNYCPNCGHLLNADTIEAAVEWPKEAVQLEKAIGKAIAKHASKIITVAASGRLMPVPQHAEVTIYGGELVKAIAPELAKMGWIFSPLRATTMEYGLIRK